MVSRRPLIVNSAANQIQELTDSDDLSLPNSSITAESMTASSSITAESMTASSSITAQSFVGAGTIPVGGIILWSGTIANIPTGWALCDGNNNTPDLRERFVVGAGSGYNPGDTGGANTVTLDITQMPSHKHDVSDTGHTHTADWFRAIGQGGATWGVANGTDQRTTNSGNANISESLKGGGQAHENRPPYYALAFIMRTV